MKFKNGHISKKLRQLFFTAIALTWWSLSFAQVNFSTNVNEKQIGQHDYVQVEYTIENAKSVERFAYSPFKNFRIIQGPVQSSGMSVTNGVMSQYKGMSFILQPIITGKLLVPGATAVIDGKDMRSNPVVIEVVPGSSTSNPSPPSWPDPLPQVNEEYTLSPGETFTDKIKKNLLVVAEVNKTSCYQGEPIVSTYKLYSRLRSESRVVKRPSLNGFSVFDMIDPEANVNPTVETLNGKSYNVHMIRKTQLVPLQPGTFVLDPVELENKVRFIRSNRKKADRKSHTTITG